MKTAGAPRLAKVPSKAALPFQRFLRQKNQKWMHGQNCSLAPCQSCASEDQKPYKKTCLFLELFITDEVGMPQAGSEEYNSLRGVVVQHSDGFLQEQCIQVAFRFSICWANIRLAQHSSKS